jgi:gluconate 2-dehydrogenase gamma chain
MQENRIQKVKRKPTVFQNIEKWQVNRRQFVKTLSVTAVLSQISFLESCSTNPTILYTANKYLTALQSEILGKVQEVLFPNDGNGPSVIEINAFNHVLWVLSDKRKPEHSVQYIIDGLDWTEETAIDEYGRSFGELNSKEIEVLVAIIAEEKWGASWLSIMLTLIFEALSLDPIYKLNTNSVGWTWLGQFVGSPKPTVEITYDNIFKTIDAR